MSSTGVMFYERPVIARRRTPRGLPGAAVRAGRLLELWGYKAARSGDRAPARTAVVERYAGPIELPEATRLGGPSTLMASRPRIF